MRCGLLAAVLLAGCQLTNPAVSRYEPSRLPVGDLTLSTWLPAGLDSFRFDAGDRQLLSEIGFNHIEWLQEVRVGDSTAEEVAMSFAGDAGLGMPVYYPPPGFTREDKLRDFAVMEGVEPGFEAAVRERVAALRQHWGAAPGFTGYLIGHEDYRARYYDALGNMVRVLGQEDTRRPAISVGNIDHFPEVGRFLDALFAEGGPANIFQHEHYIFRDDVPASGRKLQKRLDSLVAGYGRLARYLQDRHGRWHAIVQVHSETREGLGSGGPYYRKPAAGEISVQVGLALSRGASGIVYFLYSSGWEWIRDEDGHLVQERFYEGIVDRDGAPTATYAAVKELNEQLAGLGPHLRDLHFHGGWEAGDLPDNDLVGDSDSDLELGLFGDGTAATHLLVVNRQSHRGRQVGLKLAGPARDAVAGAALPQVRGRTLLDLEPGGFRLLEVQRENPAAEASQ